MRVLLVEDNPGDARLIRELVRELPGPTIAITHVETLAAARGGVADHDVALVDLTLPDATGLVAVEALAAASRTLPIVVLSGNGDERVALEALTAGAQDYLRKDEISSTLLGKALRHAIERKKLVALELAQHELEQAIARSRFTAEVTTAATSSLDPEACMRAVAPLLVPRLGDACAIDVAKDGGWRRIASAGEPGPGEASVDLPLVSRGRTIGRIALYQQRTARPFAEEDRLLAAELSASIALGIDNASLYAEAQRAIRGRDEMMAVVSHDLRNPLGVVELSLELLESNPSFGATAIPRARRAAAQMRALVDDLLQLAQIDAGTLTVRREPVELASFLDDLFEHHRVLAAEKKIVVEKSFAPHLGSAPLDSNRLTQALGNLLGNAIKFTPMAGQVRLTASPTTRGVVISVSDTGPGIPPEQLARIFDRFWQADRQRNGIGLGLPIARGIIHAHGGTIDVKSEPGGGTTFRVTLPTAPA